MNALVRFHPALPPAIVSARYAEAQTRGAVCRPLSAEYWVVVKGLGYRLVESKQEKVNA